MNSSSAPGSVRIRLALLVGVLFLAVGTDVRAESLVVGLVTDNTTGNAVDGADVTIRRGGEELGSTRSDPEGRFRLSISVGVGPQAQNLKLFIKRDGFVEATGDVVVVSGRPDSPSYRFHLLPTAISACRRNRDHAVVVGYFRPPTSASGDMDLASRIADALNYDLLTRIQQVRLAPDAQPFVLACGQVRAQTYADYPNFAKALRADAFVSGYVVRSGERFKVEMCIADRFDLLVPPPQVSSRDVNLDDPAAARLGKEAHTAVLTAIVAGYREARKYAECVEVTVAAERILGALPPAIADERRKCQAALPNRKLTPGGPP